MSTALALWPAYVLIVVTLGSGAAAGLVLGSWLELRDLSRAAIRGDRVAR